MAFRDQQEFLQTEADAEISFGPGYYVKLVTKFVYSERTRPEIDKNDILLALNYVCYLLFNSMQAVFHDLNFLLH